MPTHWTYDNVVAASDLEQGDLITPSPGLRQILDRYHKYFADDKYTLFMIASQSCDLVRHKGEDPKASYITIAAVRPLRHIVARLMSEVVPSVAEGMFRRSGQTQWRDFLSRLFNQNEQALGLFYLHKDSDAGVDEESVVFLRITVALKSEHYRAILASRVGQLRPEFRAKLGWLLGNLFARPATTDWNEKREDAVRLKEMIRDNIEVSGCRWVDDALADIATSQGIDIKGKSDEEIERLRPAPPLDEAIEEILRQVRGAAGKVLSDKRQRTVPAGQSDAGFSPEDKELMDDLIKTLRGRLRSSPKFKSLMS